MRLTLRTLLAYLDDILEPAQAQEIGRKTAESSAATALTNRIREVLRRRRLTAPDLNGPSAGLDPNTVAEYLDNTLPPDGVADVEKVCLDSDVHLAEVAACHQILTLVLGEPVDVIPDSRERMYALGPVGTRSTAALAEPPAVDEPAFSGDSKAAARAVSESAERAIPQYLRKKPLWQRILPVAAVIAVLLIWLGLFTIDQPFGLTGIFSDANTPATGRKEPIVAVDNTEPPRQPVRQENPDVAVAANTDDERPITVEIVPEEEVVVAAADSNATAVDPDTAANSVDEPIPAEALPEPLPAGKSPFEVATTDATGDSTIDSLIQELEKAVGIGGDNSDVAATKTGSPSANGEEAPELPLNATDNGAKPELVPSAQAPERGSVILVQYQSQTGILLYNDSMHEEWRVMPRRSVVYPDDLIVSPAPFESTLIVDNGTCKITLLGGTRVRSLGENKAGKFGLEVQEGRVVLESHPAGLREGVAETVTVGLAVDDKLWRIELLTPGTVCGVEVVRRQPDQPGQTFEELGFGGRLYVHSGTARLADGREGVEAISAGQWRSLVPGTEDLVSGLSDLSGQLASGLPSWLDRSAANQTLVDRRNEAAFEKEFIVDQPVRLTIPAVVLSPRPSISELAVKCLALTQTYPALVQALAEADHEEARMAAFVGIRNWLPTQPENAELLRTELAGHFQAENLDTVERLLWGFTAEDLKVKEPLPTPSRQLLQWMEHGHPAIREMAFHYVSNLTGMRYNYRPLNPPSQRRAALDRWLEHLEKQGSLLQ